MSDGSTRNNHLMAPLMLIVCGNGRNTSHYNRIYEAVAQLPDATARNLVSAIRALLDDTKEQR